MLDLSSDMTFLSNSADVARKVGDAYPTGAPGPSSQFYLSSIKPNTSLNRSNSKVNNTFG